MRLLSAPPNLHVAVNLPIALIWMVGIPFVVCWFLPIPLWWAVLIAPVWSLLTGRITDRWLPALTEPVIDRAFFAIGGKRRPPASLKPESDFIVETTNSCVRSTRSDGAVEEISWDELTGIDIETNSLGPFAPDVFWILHGEQSSCIIPQGAKGDGELLKRVQQLPGFASEVFIAAMASTSEAVFRVWRRNEETE